MTEHNTRHKVVVIGGGHAGMLAAAIPRSVPGAIEFTLPIIEFEAAPRLHARLEEVPTDAPVTVVGSGLTDIETAPELTEQGHPGHSGVWRNRGVVLEFAGSPVRRKVAVPARCHRARS
ncbi:hypothetical protein [Plantactinospora endophytica]|uniref:FAD/NAD(P)-binding domain-containing protein n=1 Tax=Plantactinospora endophytica TaxID=673535 RepID=A0ABQ4EEH5_9ACTN|nr:hypothetical protein [Plantactinospora endophytica]GIG93129.1 hypothetical protein Pen02_80650 [Plantactinospora endophytica]